MEVVVWSAWARDWDGGNAEVIAERALHALHQGGFVLLHDTSGDGVGATPVADGGLDRALATELMLTGMDERGYRSDTVGNLLKRYPAVRTVWT
jgi:hypothetical protein